MKSLKMVTVTFKTRLVVGLWLIPVLGFVAFVLSLTGVCSDDLWNLKLRELSDSDPKSMSPSFQTMFTNRNVSDRIIPMLRRGSTLQIIALILLILAFVFNFPILISVYEDLESVDEIEHYVYILLAFFPLDLLASWILQLISLLNFDRDHATAIHETLFNSTGLHWPCGQSGRNYYKDSMILGIPQNASDWESGGPWLCQLVRLKSSAVVITILYWVISGATSLAMGILVFKRIPVRQNNRMSSTRVSQIGMDLPPAYKKAISMKSPKWDTSQQESSGEMESPPPSYRSVYTTTLSETQT